MQEASDLSQELLERATFAWAPGIRFLHETTSTNTEAAEWARQGAPDGCIVVADHQTAGRGRLDRSWHSVPGQSLLFSMVLRPALSIEAMGIVNLIAGASLCRSFSEAGYDARVKWPNDVLVDGRKVSGMLSEIVQTPDTALVLGIGINVNLDLDRLPEDVRESAWSLAGAKGSQVDRLEVLLGFLDSFGPRYGGISEGANRELLKDYKRWCETLGREVRVETGAGFIEGVASDVDATGALILESGEVVRVGDVVHLR